MSKKSDTGKRTIPASFLLQQLLLLQKLAYTPGMMNLHMPSKERGKQDISSETWISMLCLKVIKGWNQKPYKPTTTLKIGIAPM